MQNEVSHCINNSQCQNTQCQNTIDFQPFDHNYYALNLGIQVDEVSLSSSIFLGHMK